MRHATLGVNGAVDSSQRVLQLSFREARTSPHIDVNSWVRGSEPCQNRGCFGRFVLGESYPGTSTLCDYRLCQVTANSSYLVQGGSEVVVPGILRDGALKREIRCNSSTPTSARVPGPSPRDRRAASQNR